MQESPKLTDRQQQILDLVQSAIERTGAPPTRAEIANELGFRSANAAEEHLLVERDDEIGLVAAVRDRPGADADPVAARAGDAARRRPDLGRDRLIPFLAVGEDRIDVEDHPAKVEQAVPDHVADAVAGEGHGPGIGCGRAVHSSYVVP